MQTTEKALNDKIHKTRRYLPLASNDRQESDARLKLACLYHDLGNNILKESLLRSYRDNQDDYLTIIEEANMKAHYATAIEEYGKAKLLTSDNRTLSRILEKRGIAYTSLGDLPNRQPLERIRDYSSAIDDFKESVQQADQEKQASIRLELGKAYTERGETVEYKQGVVIHPNEDQNIYSRIPPFWKNTSFKIENTSSLLREKNDQEYILMQGDNRFRVTREVDAFLYNLCAKRLQWDYTHAIDTFKSAARFPLTTDMQDGILLNLRYALLRRGDLTLEELRKTSQLFTSARESVERPLRQIAQTLPPQRYATPAPSTSSPLLYDTNLLRRRAPSAPPGFHQGRP